MFNIFNTKTKNLKKLALVSGAVMGAMVIGATNANASTKIDQNHVRVEQGDTVSQIAKDNGTTVDAIVQANHLTNPNMIFVGDNLVLTPNADNNNNQSASVQNNVQPASQTTNATTNSSSVSGSEAAAKNWIAQHESGGNYGASNGQYVGKFQLSASYLNGDYSPANQERVADQYVAQRYGSWTAAQQHWLSSGWY